MLQCCACLSVVCDVLCIVAVSIVRDVNDALENVLSIDSASSVRLCLNLHVTKRH